MNDRPDTVDPDEQLEIVELLDARFRLREDPDRIGELEATHHELSAKLRRQASQPPPNDDAA